VVSTIKKYTLESFSEGNVVEVGRKSVPGGWTGEETTFSKSMPVDLSWYLHACGCRNCGYTV